MGELTSCIQMSGIQAPGYEVLRVFLARRLDVHPVESKVSLSMLTLLERLSCVGYKMPCLLSPGRLNEAFSMQEGWFCLLTPGLESRWWRSPRLLEQHRWRSWFLLLPFVFLLKGWLSQKCLRNMCEHVCMCKCVCVKLVLLHKSTLLKRKVINQVGNTLLKNTHRKKIR